MCALVADGQDLVSLRGATKSYGRGNVLEVPDLRMHEKERICVLGSNGSGKSTLLRLVAGISSSTRGEVWWSPRMRSLRKGFVPQSGGANPDSSVLQHLRTMHALYEREPLDPGGSSVVAELRLEAFLHRPIRELSGGFQRLAVLSGILSVRPEVVFIDEPLSGLDDLHREAVSDAIARLEAWCSFLVVTGHSRAGFTGFSRFITLEKGSVRDDEC